MSSLTVRPHVKRNRSVAVVVLYLLTSLWWGPIVEARVPLERADGSKPTKGIPAPVMHRVIATPIVPTPVPRRAPSPAVGAGATSVWDRVARCESGGNWHINTGNGYQGGLQWLPSTWRAAGGTRYAPTAQQATREQEIAVAGPWLAKTSWKSQWPACSLRLGLR